ncbi:hypothetical protein [Synechococcus sp. BA-132 BA5]|uniref:hypothetical protein n=1 Tax=Synechococcus sp. BA-132 BA5 TaxID=3110252 RepID=UPI002B1EE69A|nr:hypothetical protein [Synechococcus sp. BA-132 BA5]MEA5413657.1 hypothetical protein [Synechococcus sp. BA-132 BA5]
MINRSSRHGVKVSHLQRCHQLDVSPGSAPVLVFTVAQGHSLPCHWAHAYALVPSGNHLISRHFSFDSGELEAYRQLHVDQSLRWMDSEFMFQLALDQILRLVRPLLPSGGDAPTPQRIDNGQLLRHHINGDLPQLEALLAQCGEHFLLHRQLQDLTAFPRLRSELQEKGVQAMAEGLFRP